MSLVSAIAEKERTSQSDSSTKHEKATKRSSAVYQTTGEPLSREALYRAKMKYGYYQSPANKPSVGVKDTAQASDSAAVLAASNKQTIDAYKRLLDPNATRAAHAVAKTKTRSRTTSVTSNKSRSGGENVSPQERASAAASKAFSMTSTREQSLGIGAITENKRETTSKDTTNKAYSLKSASSVLKQYERDQHKPKPEVIPTSKKMNLSKVLKGAESRAETRVKQRTEPNSQNFSYGIKTNVNQYNQFTLSKDMMNAIMSKTGQKDISTSEASSSKGKSSLETSAKSKTGSISSGKDHDMAMNAAYAVRAFDTRTAVDDELEKQAENRQMYLNQLTSTKVLAQARANVDKEIENIEKEDYGRQLFANDAYNRTAVSIAQKNLTKKRALVNNKINMGGGLWLSSEDIQKISQNLLNPVLGEITERADSQRAADVDIANRTKALQQNVKNWNILQTEKIANDIKYQKDSDDRLAKEKNDALVAANNKYNEMIQKMETELNKHNEEFNDTKQTYEDLKLEMSMKLDLEQEYCDKELINWNDTRAHDIQDALKEQRTLLQPYLLDLQRAQDEHDQLIKEYDTINGRITFLTTQIDEHKAKIENYSHDLEGQKEQETRVISEQDELDENKKALEEDLDKSIIVKANKVKEEAQLSAKELELKQFELDAAINERKSELNAAEISLQKEKLLLLDVMKESSELEGSPQLDEEKVKTLIGMSSAEYLSKHRPVETAPPAATSAAAMEAIPEAESNDIVATQSEPSAVTPETAPIAKTTTNTSHKSGKFGLGGLFLGSRASHNAKLHHNKTETSKSPIVASSSTTTAPPATTTTATTKNMSVPVAKDTQTLEPSFSGFSQGSMINNEDDEVETEDIIGDTVASLKEKSSTTDVNDDDDDDDIQINGETGRAGGSYLKEVF
ncbi:similar to Saccharomyces cerevisiae YMR031C EIS1 Component of the eisosome that is required for proper eisosome assembly [Maudiozyma saulgeensis]|uniref:Similar to Saccharomyces cerevisiae YMR031C EIS1 Component of the eisosome that is required for proper eisosome assembly n=1 Tax=Maudiozyma saulgeensis TaxID=1789683 RepID=A0A1X7R8H9_9SACH|nr:similar to Saccharomyces cerevisiae YMR031C EIS1 Component of the eisosome that is required for proper eisosome assembly [Kazachstania saulgeensis]